jgi:DNA primase
MDPRVTSRFRIGYAAEGWNELRDALLGAKFPESDLLSAGLVKRSDRGGGTYDLFRNRLIIPIFDLQGRVVGFGGRVLDDSLPKYINSPETTIFHKSRIFYGLNLARRALSQDRYAVVVEGYTDVIMAHSRGVPHAIATLGTAMTEDHARQLRRMVDRVILLFDGDEAGHIAAGRGVEVLLSNDLDVTVLTLAEGRDPFEYFSRHSAEEFQAMLRTRGEDFFDFTVRFHGGRLDLSTPGGKARLARILLKLVHCHGDLIKKNLLIKKIAGTLGIDEDVLRKEYRNAYSRGTGAEGGPNRPDPPPRAGVTITSSEDDLIIGLIREPSLAERFQGELEGLEPCDEEAGLILGTIRELAASGRMNLRELTGVLQPRTEAMKRVILLASDPRKTDPERLVTSALEALKKRRLRKEYEALRSQSRTLLRDKAEADRILEELDRKLKRKTDAGASETQE